jgi:cytochrome c2
MLNDKNQESNRLLIFWVVWHGLGAIVIVLLPFLITGRELASMERIDAAFILTACAVFLSFATISGLLVARQERARLGRAAVFSLAIFLPAGVLILLATRLSKDIHFALLAAIIFVLLLIPLAAGRFRGQALAVLAAVCAVTLLASDLTSLFDRARSRAPRDTSISTQFYEFETIRSSGSIPKHGKGGAIARLGDKYWLATRTGTVLEFGLEAAAGAVNIEPTGLQIPINVESFEASVPPEVDRAKFRVTDILVRQDGDSAELFASHHYWNEEQGCFTLRVSVTQLGDGPNEWHTLYESTPCLPLKERGHPFGGHQAGGRMALHTDETLLLTIGDHEFDGKGSEIEDAVSQEPRSAYGKTVLIDPSTGDSEIFSVGHRNPQGLHVGPDGTIWLTEHGPKGGDELNLVIRDGNYGWPNVTYGTDYQGKSWPLNEVQGRHLGYDRPVFAWIPSIGVSNLLVIDDPELAHWQDDLLIGSMKAKTLFRMRVHDGRAIFVEEINVGERVRDLILGSDGSIVLWTDRASLMVLRPVVQDEQTNPFAMHCAGCHLVNDGLSHGNGPDLRGVFGRKAGSAEGFEYSAALKDADIRWTRQNLDRYLEDPKALVPGTTMFISGIEDPAVRSRLIDYLEGER